MPGSAPPIRIAKCSSSCVRWMARNAKSIVRNRRFGVKASTVLLQIVRSFIKFGAGCPTHSVTFEGWMFVSIPTQRSGANTLNLVG